MSPPRAFPVLVGAGTGKAAGRARGLRARAVRGQEMSL